VALLAQSALAQSAYTVVMRGLDNPRGLAVAPNGALYVTEAGRGGDGPCAPNPANELRCYGETGAITRLWRGEQKRVVEGLPSTAIPGGELAGGANDISFLGTGGAYITMGLGGGPADAAVFGNPLRGTMLHMAASGTFRVVADIAAHEFAHNPDGGPVDSNPFGGLAEPGGRLVADAGANALLHVAPNGRVKTVAVLPPQPNPTPLGPPMIQSVPTSVARGPDGALYVGELTGFPFVAGLAKVYRVVPRQAPTVHCRGFKTIMDLAFGPDGSLYVVEHATGGLFFPPNTGQLSRVNPDCTRNTLLVGLDRPTSVAIGADGAIYVTNYGVTPGIGEVLRIEP
jgi:sugar lactone lactonase YvrE